LKQARQRASRRFLNDGARSSLPQYLHTNFSELDATLDDRAGCRTAFLVFEGGAAFGLAAAVVFLTGAAGLSAGRGLERAAFVLPLSLSTARFT
jgi:hypothetical protein